MSNMSYCRFRNTAGDLRDCADNLRSLNPGDVSQNTAYERRARAELIRTAALILTELGIDDIYDDMEIDRAIDSLDDGEGYEETGD